MHSGERRKKEGEEQRIWTNKGKTVRIIKEKKKAYITVRRTSLWHDTPKTTFWRQEVQETEEKM